MAGWCQRNQPCHFKSLNYCLMGKSNKMGEISRGQKRIREGQKEVREKFEEIREEAVKLEEETNLISQQSAANQLRLDLMFQI